MEITAKAKPFIQSEAIGVNAQATIEIEARSGVAMLDTRNP